jgi:predicted outer membrane repeat protein
VFLEQVPYFFTLTGARFISNWAAVQGGAVSASSSSYATLSIGNCSFDGNTVQPIASTT